MKKLILFYFISMISLGFSQEDLSTLLAKHNSESVPYMTVDELSKQESVKILDARELSEYKVSHIKDAIYVGYNNFKLRKTIKQLQNKKQTIVVYCSLGIRSEDIAEKLKKAGYKSVYNLYGGIFEWKNNDHKVFDSKEKETERVHTFNKEWSKWLKKGSKIYD